MNGKSIYDLELEKIKFCHFVWSSKFSPHFLVNGTRKNVQVIYCGQFSIMYIYFEDVSLVVLQFNKFIHYN